MIKLNPTCFFRVNRQFILSKEVIDSFTIWFDSRLRINLSLPTDEPIFVAKNKAAEFKGMVVLLLNFIVQFDYTI